MIGLPKRKKNTKYLISLFLILILFTTFFIMYKYYVEGEKNIPFNISKLIVISSAETQNFEKNDNTYQADVVKKNNIYIGIEKNKNYKEEDAIKKIIFNNFTITKPGKKGNIKIYRSATTDKPFEYIESYEIKNSVEYMGAKNTNLKQEKMTISNQGGLIELSALIKDLGKITYTENENLVSDGTLINKLNLNNEEIKTQISFDMLMELQSGKTFKTTITLELPTGDIQTEGVCTNEIDLSKLVFKRV